MARQGSTCFGQGNGSPKLDDRRHSEQSMGGGGAGGDGGGGGCRAEVGIQWSTAYEWMLGVAQERETGGLSRVSGLWGSAGDLNRASHHTK